VFGTLFAFFRGGTRTFNEAEMKIISCVLDVLPETEKLILSNQVASVSLVQRQNQNRMVVAFYPKSKGAPALPYPGYEHCLAKVTYKSKGKKVTTALVLHDGRLMSLERNVPAALKDIESVVGVALHPKGFSTVTTEIDASEHGDHA